jgi:hypothetical protein
MGHVMPNGELKQKTNKCDLIRFVSASASVTRSNRDEGILTSFIICIFYFDMYRIVNQFKNIKTIYRQSCRHRKRASQSTNYKYIIQICPH